MINLLRINRNLRSLRRSRNILGVFVKYGFGQLVEQLQLHDYMERGRRLVIRRGASREIARLGQPVRLRLAFEELGPTFIKLGQLLSTRPDLIPKAYADELGKLQDQVPPFPFTLVADQIRSALKQPLESFFSSIDPEPLAAASIAQVHRARLTSGEDVVIKVRRPEIEHLIETDLDILMGIAYLIERHLPALATYEPTTIVKEFRRTLQREMDFTREGHTINRFAANLAAEPTVHIPRIYWSCTAESVLTMEYLDGIKISEFDRLIASGCDLHAIARNGAEIFLKQVLDHGLFHADPHPGNVLILADARLGLLDFGMVGRLSEELRHHLVDLLLAVLERDPDRIISLLLYSGDLSEEVNLRQLRHDLTDFIDNYYEIPLHEINAGRLLGEFIEILLHYRIKFPTDLMLLVKALITMEGVGRQLDPDFNMIGHLKPFMIHWVKERTAARYLSKESGKIIHSYLALLKNLPRDIQEFINRINRNKFKIDLEHRGLDRLITDLDKASNRISFSMLIAALIVGSSLIMQTDKGPMIFGFPVLGFLGYSVAALLGLWLAVGILRSGRL